MLAISQFSQFYKLGRDFILDIHSVDHILFMVAIFAVYLIKDWRKVAIIVLAFTAGYFLTLALSAYKVIDVSKDLVEYLIPVTIFVTAVGNVLKKQNTYYKKSLQSNYFLAAMFGTIHGLGFSHNLQEYLMGKPNFVQIFAYSLGIEVAHVIIVILFLITSYIFINIINVSRRDWNLVISSAIAGVAITIMFEAKYW